jgi:hypothetical protein
MLRKYYIISLQVSIYNRYFRHSYNNNADIKTCLFSYLNLRSPWFIFITLCHDNYMCIGLYYLNTLICVTIKFPNGWKLIGFLRIISRPKREDWENYIKRSSHLNIIRTKNELWVGLAFSTHGRNEIAYRIMAVRPKGKILLAGIGRKQELSIRIYTRIHNNTIIRLLNGFTCSKINSRHGLLSTS